MSGSANLGVLLGRSTTPQELIRLKTDLMALCKVLKGDVPGHEFRGNQYGVGGSAKDSRTKEQKAADHPYEKLLSAKSTKLLTTTGGRKIYSVVLNDKFRSSYFQFGRGFVLPSSFNYEVKEKAAVTGVPSDKGYLLIDKTEQNKSRGFSRSDSPETNLMALLKNPKLRVHRSLSKVFEYTSSDSLSAYNACGCGKRALVKSERMPPTKVYVLKNEKSLSVKLKKIFAEWSSKFATEIAKSLHKADKFPKEFVEQIISELAFKG